eukprot:3940347-Rhodomonas_salina.1
MRGTRRGPGNSKPGRRETSEPLRRSRIAAAHKSAVPGTTASVPGTTASVPGPVSQPAAVPGPAAVHRTAPALPGSAVPTDTVAEPDTKRTTLVQEELGAQAGQAVLQGRPEASRGSPYTTEELGEEPPWQPLL